MRIVVTVKDVLSLDDDFEVDGLQIKEQYITQGLNEWDEYALEEAVQIAESNDDTEVITITVGPKDTEETIREALAKGADRGIRVWDEALSPATMLDPSTKAMLLAAVTAEEDPDLVLTGVQSADDGLGATGVMMAEQLEMEWATVVNSLELNEAKNVAHTHRELEGGLVELTDVELPAVFTIQTGINDPRYASLRGIRQAQNKELDVRSLADLGLDPGALESPIEQTALYEPEAESEATLFEGSAEESAAELVGVLRERGVDQ